MKTHLWLIGAAMVAIALSACSESIEPQKVKDENRKNQYTKAWIETIGLIPADQDWCMVDAVTVNVSTEGLEKGATTKIYTSDPNEGGRLKATITDFGSLPLDVTEGTTTLYAVMYDPDGIMVAEGFCDIADGSTTITPTSLAPKRMSRHVDENPYNTINVTFDAILVCEDLGTIGDFDFNDIVLGLTTVKESSKTTLTITPLAAGGTYEANIYFNDEDKGEIHSLMSEGGVSPSGKFYNTSSFGGIGVEIEIEISGTTWSIANNWGDIKIRVEGAANDAIEISKSEPGNAPQMICLPGDFYWPKERTSIKEAYTGFVTWATGGYTGEMSTWTATKATENVVPWEATKKERVNYFIATCNDGTTYKYENVTYTTGDKVDVGEITSCRGMFDLYSNYTLSNVVALDLNGSHFDTSNVTSMQLMFNGCKSLTSLDLSNFDTSKVMNMNSMFYGCSGLTSLDLSNFDTSKVMNMNSMFDSCSKLTTLDLSKFDTSNVTSMRRMFDSCSKLTTLDLSKFDTSNVTDMFQMFSSCYKLTSLDISKFDTSKVTRMDDMFSNCSELTSLDTSKFNTSEVTDMSGMFLNCGKISTLYLSNFNTSNVENMLSMFNGCISLTSLDISKFDTSKVKKMSSMFKACSDLTSLDLSNFDTSIVTDMTSMFHNCTSLTSLDLSNFDISKVTSKSDMFNGCPTNLKITCKAAFRDWCIENKNVIKLPSGLQDPTSSQWHIVD